MVGSTPCVYNPVLDQTIMSWWGYNPDLPTDYIEQGFKFSFSYYADTFIYGGTPTNAAASPSTSPSSSSSSSSHKWLQVLKHIMPKSHAHLIVDPQSGKTYLFGGFTNNDYVPSCKSAISRAFGDLWELGIDLPGGRFEGLISKMWNRHVNGENAEVCGKNAKLS